MEQLSKEFPNPRLPHLEGLTKRELIGCARIRAVSEAFMENSNVKVPIAPPETKVSFDTIVQ
jgi:hypothetical protein